ncbi:PAAR domain-containing protein [Rhizobium sp. XQZ8]|uniref:PAAR domain-containing protein n=1 Tax=Rhizobium populisoli TaxID=2859785 RepID=UPI001C66A56D|nr:PAAR domain-containing protein [Rhizobium populisoli]MBW6425275.1 PAAR domain-containing protein [Rhizobium populisoli]
MGQPTATIGKMHVCPQVDPGPTPHVGGPIMTGQAFVRINGVPVAVVGDSAICTGCGQMDRITKGSSIARINGRPIARLGDATAHGGKITEAVPTVRMD